VTWFLELGFEAVKIFLREGPEAGIARIRRSEELVARTREQIGADVELMGPEVFLVSLQVAVAASPKLTGYTLQPNLYLLLADAMKSA
jgi:hypothetical protein